MVLNDKLYVTNASSKAVTVYDTATNAYVASIAVGKTVEKIVAAKWEIICHQMVRMVAEIK